MYCDLYSLDLYRNFVGYATHLLQSQARYSYPNGTAFRASTRFARLSGLDSKYSVSKSPVLITNSNYESRMEAVKGEHSLS